MRKISKVAVAALIAVAALMVQPLVASAATAGTEHVTIVTTNPNSHANTIIVTGVFAAGGIDYTNGHSPDLAVFPKGAFSIYHASTGQTQSFNPKTCVFRVTGTGTYTLSHGFGAYRGISGSGTYSLHIVETANRNAAGKCGNHATAYEEIIHAGGPVSL